LLGAKVLLDLHDPMPELMMTIFGLTHQGFAVRALKKFEKWSIAFADSVLTPNAAFARLFASRSCRPDKLRVVMNSPDERIFTYVEGNSHSSERPPGKPFVVMYHGSLVERHGLDIAVEALVALRSSIQNVELRIFGRATPFVQEVMELAASRGLNGSVRYLGARSLEQIVQEIDACDVGVIPNRRSAFTEINMPTRIFEYLSRGKPVIAPFTSGIQDYFTPQSMIFFQAGSAEDLAAKLQDVFLRPQEVQQIVQRGQSVYGRYKWSQQRLHFLTRVCDLFESRRCKPNLQTSLQTPNLIN
jgi:glycosyltransferase involved in cell wall biosynthesis